ncbi:hypothetical protein MCOR02_006354 [Pyricularia oryzae]|uniref:FAD-binding PCMH-type domain-containing protein n=1 Tax=Pyricularia oryzae TaxID=318829 RepID=A0A4P7NJG8_PYROR|nr:hypothetical protein MCOR02_006354 [Pyricularia oryzae]KAI6313122.1 hypothetical protein MCOR34_005333 [Pyricularia oryzae]KAI6469879.1 hypothetical protein MCOR17_003693 [Pyricularia oryzae]KAI6494086.1 hypothetical protein MCOR13_007641 [Pyricularia oryzae]KAI6578779.1 hypothetical protein MCOR04_006314 [Pyricularia oryzae]
MHFKLIASSWASLALLAAVQAASQTCDIVNNQRASIQSLSKNDGDYKTEQDHYWSTACGDLKPSCILKPKDAQELSFIMQTLQANNETFAVKSGGHNPNNYFASVQDGPLISTTALNPGVVYNAENNTVTVGPGNRWDDVMGALDGKNITVVGGRIGNVGVGGYLLGGGLGFLSTQYGWAANQIVEAEVVLANGTIVTASESANPQLLMALRGGGNNFGIVTKFVLKAYPIGQVWGGNMVFGASKTDEILAAVRDFTENYDKYPKAAIIATAELTALNAAKIWTLFLFYDGESPPAGIFDKFLAAKPTINNCKSRSYADLLSYNNWAVLHGSRYVIATETTPLPSAADGQRVMRSYYDHWFKTSEPRAITPGSVASMAFQPIPKSMARIARDKGGDLIDLDDSTDRIIFEFNYSYWFSISDKNVASTTATLVDGMKSLVDGYVADGTLPDAYRPLFMNDAHHTQDYWGRLRPEKRQLAADVRAQVDPQNIFAQRTGGIKL